MINYSAYQPNIFPIDGDIAPSEIDRAQSITPNTTLNKEPINEIGRDGKVGEKKGTPNVTYGLTQLEYGNLEIWQKLANKSVATTKIDLNDFKTSQFDIVAYLTDDDTTFLGSMLYPKLRVNGFNFSVGDPEANGERTFDLIGEKAIQWSNDNAYYRYNRHEAGSGTDNEIDLTADAPAIIPDNDIIGATDAELYIYRVLRVKAGVTTELVADTDFTYDDATKTLTIVSIATADVIKTYFTSAVAPASLFTNNDADPAVISADSVVVEMNVAGRLYKLQNVAFDVSFERTDEGEIGNKEKVLRSITSKTVNITLGKLLEDLTIEEALRGVIAGYGQIDYEKFADDIEITVKIYETSDHNTFRIGYKATGLTVGDSPDSVSVNEIVNRDFTLVGDTAFITNDINEL